MGKRKSSQPIKAGPEQRARVAWRQGSLANSSSDGNAFAVAVSVVGSVANGNRDTNAPSGATCTTSVKQDVSGRTGDCRSDSAATRSPVRGAPAEDQLLFPESSGHVDGGSLEPYAMPGRPIEEQETLGVQVSEAALCVPIHFQMTDRFEPEHLDVGCLEIHHLHPSRSFCEALDGKQWWSSEVWLYVTNQAQTILCAVLKPKSKGKPHWLAEQFPDRLDEITFQLLATISELPCSKPLVKLVWHQLPQTDAASSIFKFDVSVHISALAFVQLTHATTDRFIRDRLAVRAVIKHFYSSLSLSIPMMQEAMSHQMAVATHAGEHYAQRVAELYEAVKSYHQARSRCGCDCSSRRQEVWHGALLPTLRSYQERAVHWMLEREGAATDSAAGAPAAAAALEGIAAAATGSNCSSRECDGGCSFAVPEVLDLAPFFNQLHDVNGKVFYFHEPSGMLIDALPEPVPLPLGGILADEMGLGKTVEVLACILAHPRQRLLHTKMKPAIHCAAASTVTVNDTNTVTDDTSNCIPNGSIDAIPEEEQLPFSIFTTAPIPPRSCLECTCGQTANAADSKARVQCSMCGTIQHAECVGFDPGSDSTRYKCPYCHIHSDPIPSSTTLVVSPASIAHQWLEEIHRHIRPGIVKVMMYMGADTKKYVQPQTLCNYDIIVTTYEVLSKELWFTTLPHNNSSEGRRFRHPKRFLPMPSPLEAIQWWRICLDEAQMVEATTTKTAEMALKLHAVNRWCVTGTPIQHTLDDLYGLLLFLGVKPFYIKRFWRSLLYEPFCAGSRTSLYDVVCRVMWRTCKADVIDEIGLRPIQEQLHKLHFQPVEEYFYRRQFDNCRTLFLTALQKFSDWTTKLSSLDRQALNQLLLPLRQLLQACCHPQVVRGAFMPTQKRALSMDEVTQRMIKNTETECEEYHRRVVTHLHGLAGLYILTKEPAKATEKYRAVLSSAARHASQDIRTDELQLLHSVHNLQLSLQMVLPLSPGSGSSTTGSDTAVVSDELEQLRAKEEEIKRHYCEKAESALARSREALQKAKERTAHCAEKLGANERWWLEVVNECLSLGLGDSLVEHVYESLQKMTHLSGSSVASNKFRNARGMILVIETALTELGQSYAGARDPLEQLDRFVSSADRQLVQAMVDCCLRPSGSRMKTTCAFCIASDLLSKYEYRIFHFVDGIEDAAGLNSDDESVPPGEPRGTDSNRKGLWKESELEIMLKAIADFSRRDLVTVTALDPDVIEASANHLKLFEAWRAEFKPLRALWVALHKRVSSLDELEMATERLRVRTAAEDDEHGGTALRQQQPNVIDEWQLASMITNTSTDLSQDEWQLAKKMRHLQYLRHLAEGSKGKGLEPCPICCTELSGSGWSMLTCGHHCCLACTFTMLGGRSGVDTSTASFAASMGWQWPNHALQRSLKCPVCRCTTASSAISLVQQPRERTDSQTLDSESPAKPSTVVKGSHSTKVEGIVRCLLQIIHEKPQAKAIVFSTWTDALCHVACALKENGIRFVEHSNCAATSRRQLVDFRTNATTNVLLMPLSHGSKGLNIVEATHVLFTEPIFNPAQELQAVGRIHRIGQTRDTFVHHFTIENTIEEKLQAALKRLAADSTHRPELDAADDLPFTLQDLADMFDVREEVSRSGVRSPGVGDREPAS